MQPVASVVRHTSMAPANVPLTQNTAPVIEFRCLFTSDLRRKQKRWQDGRLKFHTFNKRVMVYDDRLNYVGDTHWHDSRIDEGEELELERGAVLVQVADCLGSRDQDLTELLDKHMKQREERATARKQNSSAATTAPFDNIRIAEQHAVYSKTTQKPLSALLWTPTGHHGRALLPATSPFEDRQNKFQQVKEDREPTSKRRKVEATYAKAGYAQNLTGATLDLSSTPHSTAPFRREPLWARTSRRQDGIENFKDNGSTVGAPGHQGFAPLNNPQEQTRQTQRHRLLLEKKAKSSFAQNLTGAVLDLSSTQKANTFLRHQQLAARNVEMEGAANSPLKRGDNGLSNDDMAQSTVPQPPVIRKWSTNLLIANNDARGFEKIVRNDTTVRPIEIRKHVPSEAQQRDAANILEKSPAVDEEFIDIEAIDQDCHLRRSPRISNSNISSQNSVNLQLMINTPPIVSLTDTSKGLVAIDPAESSGPALEVADKPPETVGSIRLKSRPKKKMLLLAGNKHQQQPPASTNRTPISPKDDLSSDQSQTMKKLDEFHKLQKKQLKARIGKAKADTVQDGTSSASDTDNACHHSIGHGGSEPVTLSRQLLPGRIAQTERSDIRHEDLQESTTLIAQKSPEPAIPQSSEPAFEQLRNIGDRIPPGGCVALQTTSPKALISTILDTVADENRAQAKTTRKSRLKEPVIAPTTIAANNSSPEVLPKRPQLLKSQLLKTTKKSRSKVVVGWVGAPKDPAVIHTQQARVAQSIAASEISWADAQRRVERDVGTTRAVATPINLMQDAVQQRQPAVRKSIEEKGKNGVNAACSDSGPWSREAFDLFDWRPVEMV